LQQSGAIGADLNWWSAKRTPEGGVGPAANPWTKVLTGRYLLDGGGGASRPKFFKLLAAADSHSVIESARRIEQKLTHIKITSTVLSRNTGLIVSEKVGAKVARSRPLGEIFGEIDRAAAFKIAGQIAEQVEQLGELLDDNRPLKSLLWPAHDEQVLRTQWDGVQARLPAGAPTLDPVALFAELHQSDQSLWLRERSLVHGDLHMNNVALDLSDTGPEAYIFDPGVMARSAAGRDLAVLEVSVLLHQPLDLETLIQVCPVIYDVSKPLDQTLTGPKSFTESWAGGSMPTSALITAFASSSSRLRAPEPRYNLERKSRRLFPVPRRIYTWSCQTSRLRGRSSPQGAPK
jgi:hypothetical protein